MEGAFTKGEGSRLVEWGDRIKGKTGERYLSHYFPENKENASYPLLRCPGICVTLR